MATERAGEALTILGEITDSDDPSGAISLRKADLEFRSGKRVDAVRRVDAVLGKEPGHARALLLKAQFLSALLNWNGALSFARSAVAADNKSSEAHATLGRALLATRDLENAFKEFSEAFRLNPELQADID